MQLDNGQLGKNNSAHISARGFPRLGSKRLRPPASADLARQGVSALPGFLGAVGVFDSLFLALLIGWPFLQKQTIKSKKESTDT